MLWVLLGLLGWAVASLPLALAVGALLRSHPAQAPADRLPVRLA